MGQHGFWTGKPMPEETRKKISATLVNYYEEHPEAREHLAELNRGKHHTEESKAKMSASHKAKNKKLEEEKSDD